MEEAQQNRHWPNPSWATIFQDLFDDALPFAQTVKPEARRALLAGMPLEHTADFPAALDRALTCGTPALIEIRIPQDACTPSATLEQIREQGRRARGA